MYRAKSSFVSQPPFLMFSTETVQLIADRRGVGRLRRPTLRGERLQNASSKNDAKEKEKQPGLELGIRRVSSNSCFMVTFSFVMIVPN